jgi:hypothetical protein
MVGGKRADGGLALVGLGRVMRSRLIAHRRLILKRI